MPADLTRFDFHAMRFMNSETVESMNSDEVGQYVLLLCKSWLIGKDASLPDDLGYLAAIAKGSVKPKVLQLFPIVDTPFGKRRRNNVLYGEWLKVVERSEIAAENGKKGGMSASVYKTDAARENGNLGGRPRNPSNGLASNPSENPSKNTENPSPNQSKPIQTNPSQTNDSGNFRNLAIRYRKAFAVNLSHGTQQKAEYAKACAEFGEDLLLEKFESWTPDNQWIRERHHTNGLRQFYEALPAMIEADNQLSAEKVLDTANEIVVDYAALKSAREEQHERIMAADLAKRQEEATAKEIPFTFGV